MDKGKTDMKKIFSKISLLLNKKQKWTMVELVFMMIVGAALEVFSVAIVMGVISLIVSPSVLETNGKIATLYRIFHFKDFVSFQIFLMLMLIVAYIAKNAYLFLEWKAMYAFVYKNQFRTSERLFKNYLKRDYEYYLYADTAVIQRSITSDVNNMFALILSLLRLFQRQ